MKNENGTGTVYKMKGNRRKPWIAVVSIGYTLDGKQKRKTIGTAPTKREAQEMLYNYHKNPRLYSGATFKEVRERWYERYEQSGVTQSTLKITKIRMKNFIPLENIPISEIKLDDMQSLFDSLKVTKKTKTDIRGVLNLIFDYALKNDLVRDNKVRFIELGKNEKVVKRRIFTSEEISILWDNTGSFYARYILILIYTGMRIGEFLSLKNKDIDLIKGTITITKAKTQAGIRTIPISDKIYPVIKSCMNLDNKYFVSNTKGGEIIYPKFHSRFNETLNELEIGKHTIHDTRHTFATLLNNSNANPTSVTKLIGHRNFTTTEDIYIHKDIEELKKAINLI